MRAAPIIVGFKLSDRTFLGRHYSTTSVDRLSVLVFHLLKYMDLLHHFHNANKCKTLSRCNPLCTFRTASMDSKDLDDHQHDVRSEYTIESASDSSTCASLPGDESKPLLLTPARQADGSPSNKNLSQSPHTPSHHHKAYIQSPSVSLLPHTPIKAPPNTPTTPIPTILYTPVHNKSINSTPTSATTPLSSTPSSSAYGTPSSRTRLLPLWHNSAMRLGKTLRRAASFASFGERSAVGEESEGERRVSSEPAFELPVRRAVTFPEKDDIKELIVVGHVVETPIDAEPGSAPVAFQEAETENDLVYPAPPSGEMDAETEALPNDSSQPNLQPATPSPEIRASILSTGSELSAQWYRSPRERLGLFLTVTKRGSAPWERKGERSPLQERPVVRSPLRVNHGKRTWKTLWLSSSRKG
jgi:hypothetical protein